MRNSTHVLYEMPSLDEFTELLKTGSILLVQPDMSPQELQEFNDSLDDDGFPF